MTTDYKSAGVDIEAGYEAVRRIKQHAKSTYNERVLGDLGNFSGLFSIANMGIEEPVLVSGTDGVGTKLKLAFALDKHDTIGIDCVAMCVNDVVCQGATPLFFLDYIAVGKLFPEQVERIVCGVSEGCKMAGCALIGGETAEMPGFYPVGEYDVAGFAVGIVDRKKIIDGHKVTVGDAIIGIASSGVHSNGFSLVRKLAGETKDALNREFAGIGKLGEALITPTRIYVKSVLEVMNTFDIHGAAHITGGGFYENIPRMLKDDQSAVIIKKSWTIPKLFEYLCAFGELNWEMAFNTFNMGVGMTLCIDQSDAQAVVDMLNAAGEHAFILGHVASRQDEHRVIFQ